ncbi:MAG: DUF4212 domain-containing protein [Proteobacteria bacterium]|nr:DUF4212 domain-containing protein [Pseudomonadota bacterium]RTL28230.1 MAG: DUF4212 domain-containing protein [Rhodocyclaceae bacterium]
MSDTDTRRQAYWRATLRLTGALLLLWAAVSFLPAWFAGELNTVDFMGWPLGFYMAAQGALLVFLAIVWFYAQWMDRLDRRFGVRDDR